MLVQNKGELVRIIGVRLVPGVNNLSAADSKKYADEAQLPLNKYLIDHGEIAVVSPGNISSVSPEKAVQLVNDTFDLGLLDQFIKDEAAGKNRKTVIDAINTQIDSIKNPPADKVVDRNA